MAEGEVELACSLSNDDLQGRMLAWRELGATAIDRTLEPGRVTTTYPPDPAIAERLDALIAAEAECCAFLEFDVRRSADSLVVELRYPPEFEPMLALVIPDDAHRRAPRAPSR